MEKDAQDRFRDILINKFEEARERNFRVSKRYFADKIGVSSGALSDILNNKRPITRKFVEKVSSTLELSPSELNLIYDKRDKNYFEFISVESFNLIADDIHFIILSLMDTNSFVSEFDWISKKIKRSIFDVKKAIHTLKALRILDVKDNSFCKLKGSLHSPDEVPSVAIRKSHRQTLEEADSALTDISLHKRDFTSLIFSTDPELMPLYKDLIRKFRKEILDISNNSNDNNKSEVFKVAVQLFPLTDEKVV